MTENDPDYYRRRATEERALAAKATDKCARQAHERLAEEYEQRAQAESSRPLNVVQS